MQATVPHLGVCWIWGSPFVWTRSVETMLELRHPAGVQVSFHRGTGWGPAKRHIDACEKAVAAGCTHLLILGADQTYEPDLLERLWARVQEGYEVVSALVPSRGYIGWLQMEPFQKMAWRLKSNGLAPIAWGADAVEPIDPADGDMQRIDFIGSGCLLFATADLLALRRPWFFESIDHETQRRTASMDTKFVYRLHDEAEVQVWVDTTIKIGHLHPFEIDDTFPARFADWSIEGMGDPDVCRFSAPPTPMLVGT